MKWVRRRASWLRVARVGLMLATALAGFTGWKERGTGRAAPAPTVLYETRFEVSEGFDELKALAGQGGWSAFGTGGNGLTSGFIAGAGQHAYVGFTPPTDRQEGFLNLLREVNYAPVDPKQAMVKFSVKMQIVASTNGRPDDFRWSVYNTAGVRLLSLDFDTTSSQISYALESPATIVPTGFAFDTLGAYDLVLWLDLGRNLWAAWLNNVVLINSQALTTAGSARTLDDVDAVWAIRRPETPGDNFMLFDDYRIEIPAETSIPPTLELRGVGSNGLFTFRIYGSEKLAYVVEGSADLRQWEAIGTFTAPAGGTFDFEDVGTKQTKHRFFRVRHVP